MSQSFVTRFAPSPSGFLHLGHAYSALLAYRRAADEGGRFLLRIEDIDPARSKTAFVEAIFEDLEWLGIKWENPVRTQSRHIDDYQAALATLNAKGLIYPCFCTRKDIAAEIARSATAPHGPAKGQAKAQGSALYPGTCRRLRPVERDQLMVSEKSFAFRLDVEKAAQMTGPLTWHDKMKGEIAACPALLGDVVVARKDTPTSYHLAVTVDDAIQNISHVIRGEDLFHSTHIHRLLQALLNLPTPRYHHHKLLLDANGKRLAKRDQAQTIRARRHAGVSADEIVARLI
jgi:glutamyl-Q tRNA(Asp) synthetase